MKAKIKIGKKTYYITNIGEPKHILPYLKSMYTEAEKQDMSLDELAEQEERTKEILKKGYKGKMAPHFEYQVSEGGVIRWKKIGGPWHTETPETYDEKMVHRPKTLHIRDYWHSGDNHDIENFGKGFLESCTKTYSSAFKATRGISRPADFSEPMDMKQKPNWRLSRRREE